jgi:mannose-6-phosphate isomerase-like protein (cupin superfamily)
VKRHPSLVSLSHDHERALVQAQKLRRGEVDGFAEFFALDLVGHFRLEEERVFPLLAEMGVAPPELVQALLEHQRIRAAASRPDGALGELLESHIRLEERVLFETIQRVVPDERLAALLPSGQGGPEWGAATAELNATLLSWPPGGGTPEHVNKDRDVVLVVVDGTAAIEIDGTLARARAGDVFVLEKGRSRKMTAGPGGVRYLTVHRRRDGIEITRTPRSRPVNESVG